MPDELPKPPAPEPPPDPRSGVWSLGWRLLGMNAEQQRGAVALVLIGLSVWLVIYLLQEASHQRAADRANDIERTAMMVRAFEGESEKGRQAIRDMAASHQRLSTELGKLEQRVADLTAATGELKTQMAELKNALAELRKKLPPAEVNAAPHPRAKAVTAAG